MNSDREDQLKNAADERPKRSYEKPAIIWLNAIDTRAISIGCAQSDPGNPVCKTGTLQS